MTAESGNIRDEAEKRLKNRRQFWGSVGSMVAVFLVLVVVWGLTSSWSGYFWPMWPGFGFAIAIVFQALSVFGPLGRPISQRQIDDEVRRMGGDANSGT
jgi:hypothetical protein